MSSLLPRPRGKLTKPKVRGDGSLKSVGDHEGKCGHWALSKFWKLELTTDNQRGAKTSRRLLATQFAQLCHLSGFVNLADPVLVES